MSSVSAFPVCCLIVEQVLVNGMDVLLVVRIIRMGFMEEERSMFYMV